MTPGFIARRGIRGTPVTKRGFMHLFGTVFRYSRKNPTEEVLRELILERWHDKFETGCLEKVSFGYSSLYATLLEFAEARRLGMLFLPSEYE